MGQTSNHKRNFNVLNKMKIKTQLPIFVGRSESSTWRKISNIENI